MKSTTEKLARSIKRLKLARDSRSPLCEGWRILVEKLIAASRAERNRRTLSFIVREPDGEEWHTRSARPMREMREDYSPAVVVGVVGNPLSSNNQ